MFHRQRKTTVPLHAHSLKNATRLVSPAQFLNEDKRQNLLKKMSELSGLEESRYQSLCTLLIENLVNYCQNLPETANSYYSQPGGVVDYALNRTEAALSLFHDFMIHEQPNLFSEEQKLWQYALYSAAMLQGIGKLYVDYTVNVFDATGQWLTQWNPMLDSLNARGAQYEYDLQKESDVTFRCRLNLLLARALMPASGFSWIASNPEVLAAWLALLNEDYRSAGTLGALLIRADAIAIQRYFSEFLVRNAGRAGRSRHPSTFGGGDHESIIDKEQALGVEFIQWLTKSLDDGRIMINKAPLLMVPGGLLMCQEMYHLFMRDNPQYKNWQAIQKGFLSLGLHASGADGLAVSRYEQAHTEQMHSGVVFSKYAIALPASIAVNQLATGKVESMSAIELAHRAQYTNQFSQQQAVVAIPSLQQLNAAGQWLAVESDMLSLKAGVKRSA